MRGDVLLSKSGSIGTVALVDTDKEFSIYESIFVLRANRKVITNDYLLWAMRSTSSQVQYTRHLVGMGVTHLNQSDFVDVVLPSPPLEEQIGIASTVTTQSLRMEEIEARTRDSLDRLREYRQALISAAVTGKIDVTKETV
jgi:type I restriction enzyme S subunit